MDEEWLEILELLLISVEESNFKATAPSSSKVSSDVEAKDGR